MLGERLGPIRGSFVLSGWLAWSAMAAPPLTTIQDVLYKADGKRFNGTAVISWRSFEAGDTSNIGAQAVTVKIANGNLWVQLVPNQLANPVNYYAVRYNSDGKVAFDEIWAVPPSPKPLRVRDVRTAALASTALPILENDILGLQADLGARPVKGPGYAPSRIAFINPDGALEAVIGNLSDCVRIDGTAGPCGASQIPFPPTVFVDAETPVGIVDGSNSTFRLAGFPRPESSLTFFRNGILQKLGLDYSFSGNTIVCTSASIPQPGDTLLAFYRL